MKGIFFLTTILWAVSFSSVAQQRIEPGIMNYIAAPKPNNIIYHDTLFKGSPQFAQLFYRSGNPEIIYFYEKHRSNKIIGQVMGITGTLATIFGISIISSSGSNKGTGWALLGGGFVATLTGGYLTFMGQRNLQMAVTLFNKQNHKAALGIGVAEKNAGLVFKF